MHRVAAGPLCRFHRPYQSLRYGQQGRLTLAHPWEAGIPQDVGQHHSLFPWLYSRLDALQQSLQLRSASPTAWSRAVCSLQSCLTSPLPASWDTPCATLIVGYTWGTGCTTPCSTFGDWVPRPRQWRSCSKRLSLPRTVFLWHTRSLTSRPIQRGSLRMPASLVSPSASPKPRPCISKLDSSSAHH